MFSNPFLGARERPYEARARQHTRRLLAAVSAVLILVLAALPTASAFASADPSLPSGGAGKAERSGLSVGRLVAPGELLSAGELQGLLAALPLGDLNAAQLARYLAGLEGVSVLAQLKAGGLLGGKQLGVVGLEESLRKAIEKLGPSAKLGELASVEGFLPALNGALEGKLGALLKVLLGALPTGSEEALENTLGTLSLDQLVSSLLKSTEPGEQLAGELSGLASGLFGELGAEHKLEGLLGGSELIGGFTPQSVKQVSEELKTTTQAVSKEIGGEATELLPETTMLTAPLANGKLAGVAPAVKGLVTGLLGSLSGGAGGEEKGGSKGSGGSEGGKGSGEGAGKGTGEGSGKGSAEGTATGSGSGEGKGTGGSGGLGGSGAGGSGGSTTVVLTMPGTAPAAHGAAKGKAVKVTILSHKVRGAVATVVLRVPSAGVATLTGKGVRAARKQAARAERLTLRVALTRASSTSLRRHHRLRVKLRASFRPTSGSRSAATVTVVFT